MLLKRPGYLFPVENRTRVDGPVKRWLSGYDSTPEQTIQELLADPDRTFHPEDLPDDDFRAVTAVETPSLTTTGYDIERGGWALVFTEQSLRWHRRASASRNRICQKVGLPPLYATLQDPATLARLTGYTHRVLDGAGGTSLSPVCYSTSADRSIALVYYRDRFPRRRKDSLWSVEGYEHLVQSFHTLHQRGVSHGAPFRGARWNDKLHRPVLGPPVYPHLSHPLLQDSAKDANSNDHAELNDSERAAIHSHGKALDVALVAVATTTATGVWPLVDHLSDCFATVRAPPESILEAARRLAGEPRWVEERLLEAIETEARRAEDGHSSTQDGPIDRPGDASGFMP